MIHYHGTPITPLSAGAAILQGRHAMVSFANPEQIAEVALVCQSFALDNGAFSAWRSGKPISDWFAFYAWINEWRRHPGFDWALIPDVIDGDENANDNLLAEWPYGSDGVPVWHLHESIARLQRLAVAWPRVALGSSGEYAVVGTDRWWKRMAEAMDSICLNGRPITRLHGLRMLDPEVFSVFPFASADSTNIARNINLDTRWRTGSYRPPNEAVRGFVMAEIIESRNSAADWLGCAVQEDFLLEAASE